MEKLKNKLWKITFSFHPAREQLSQSRELFEDAKQLIINTQYASTSYLQRKLRIGYNRAARIMDQLETAGVISEYVGEKKARSMGG